MLIKGDKIKLIKAIGGFDKIGDIFEITGVNELGTITISSNYGTGIMSYDEFEKYFEKVEEKPLVWGEWKRHLNDPNYENRTFAYRTNGKTIELIEKGKKVRSVCLDEDIFNLDYGLDLCLKKQDVIKAKAAIRDANKKHRAVVKELNKLLREM
ncbi:Uncharacterised protein [[Clostridium] sordellii]|uniref:hypothetical protein n=1 Tax=Paraclostridium sordellii TaxID=1505 RepID=UPI0005EA2E38|nr:hypothetical protein [Paeniclostridium sordellii]CEQ01674.1 Uncharacterised protein [[Clostridium] sordellii] [Paeniclostridium sordellii]